MTSDAERVSTAGVEQHAAVKLLDVDVMIGCGRCDLGLSRSAVLAKLPIDPSARDRNPRSFRSGPCCRANALERFSERANACPVHLARVGEPRTDRVNVRIDQAGND